ncbi:Gluconokinase, variant 2 [Balamuthia mandrillaris]
MIVVLMGVSGCGKTTIGQGLKSVLTSASSFSGGWEFVDGDDYHPKGNVEKMSSGIPLDDEDRRGWLEQLSKLLHEWAASGQNRILACSALKRRYRDLLRGGDLPSGAAEEKQRPPVVFVHLQGSFEVFQQRLRKRQHHFMKEKMLQSQVRVLRIQRGTEERKCIEEGEATKRRRGEMEKTKKTVFQ